MITDAKAGKFDVILVHKLERFTRRREDAVTYKALLKRSGVNVVTVSEPLDPDSPLAAIVEGMLEVVNEWYSVNLSREVARERRQRAQQGHVSEANSQQAMAGRLGGLTSWA
jgi:site-specific DNA recombinase